MKHILSKKATVSLAIRKRHSTWYERLIFSYVLHLIAGIAFVVFLPSFLFLESHSSYWPLSIIARNTLVANFTAFCMSSIFLYKIKRHIGMQTFSSVLPTVLISWFVVFLYLFWMREEYSRKIILTSLALASVWAVIGYFLSLRYSKARFALVPFGRATILQDARSIDLDILKTPTLAGQEYDGIIVDLRANTMTKKWERFLAECTLVHLPVYHYKHIAESLTGRVSIEHLSENIFGELQPSGLYAFFKRGIDLLGVLISAPIWIPLVLIAGIAVKLESEGPMFFIQERMGWRNKIFKVYKLRSMYINSQGREFTDVDEDPRITKVGRWIRKYRIDEIPQFINILKGDMSLIGPRPESKKLTDWYEKDVPFFVYRHIVRPGISGWAQVMQGYAAEVDGMKEKLEYDFYYIKHFSFWLDILIVVKTLKTIFTGFGAR